MKINPINNMTRFDYYLSKINIFDYIDLWIKLINNWYLLILFRAGILKTMTVKLRSGKTYSIKSIEDYRKFWISKIFLEDWINLLNHSRYVHIALKSKKLLVIKSKRFDKRIYFYIDDNAQLFNTLNFINENFINDQYKWLGVKGKDVVDIGAAVGDTAIYFALKGAKHVYAFEPYPYSYKIAQKNIRLNHLEDKITLLNEGCGKSNTVMISPKIKNYGNSSINFYNTKKGKRIPILSLEEIVKTFKINNGIMKVDCEGCEYELILNAKEEILLRFKQIIIEYHYGYKNLISKLKPIFRMRHTLPQCMHDSDKKEKQMYRGLILCDRKE